jgi:hypothetical protein
VRACPDGPRPLGHFRASECILHTPGTWA